MFVFRKHKKNISDVPASVFVPATKTVSVNDMSFWSRVRYHVSDIIGLCLAFLVSLLVRLFFLFIPMEYRGADVLSEYLKNNGPVILVFWHGRSIYVIKFWLTVLGFNKYPIYGIFSTHKDGRFMGRLLGFLGGKEIPTDKKDANQGKKAAIKSLKILRSGCSLGFTPDGPVGPRMTFVTESAFLFAKASGVPVVPVCASSFRAKLLNSWDRFMIAKPFHKTVVSVGDFLFIPKNISDAEFKKIKSDFEKKMVKDAQKLDSELQMPLVEPDDGSEKLERFLKKLKKWGVESEEVHVLERQLEKFRASKNSKIDLDKNKSSNNYNK